MKFVISVTNERRQELARIFPELAEMFLNASPVIDEQTTKQPAPCSNHPGARPLWARDKNGNEVSRVNDAETRLYQARDITCKQLEKFLSVSFTANVDGRHADFRASCWDGQLSGLIKQCLERKTPMEFFVRKNGSWHNVVGVCYSDGARK